MHSDAAALARARADSAKIAVTTKKFRQSVTKSSVGKSAKTSAVVAARGKLQLEPYRCACARAAAAALLSWLPPPLGPVAFGAAARNGP
eukprot:3495933-Prymnesium_polylepis.1